GAPGRPVSRRRVPRPRLTALLEQTSARVIVLAAPAGYGKTALATEGLEGRPRVGWYSASPAAADLAAFGVELGGAAAAVVPGAGDRLRRRARVEEAPEHAARPLAELLAEDLA